MQLDPDKALHIDILVLRNAGQVTKIERKRTLESSVRLP
jgi:hypothetical protein